MLLQFPVVVKLPVQGKHYMHTCTSDISISFIRFCPLSIPLNLFYSIFSVHMLIESANGTQSTKFIKKIAETEIYFIQVMKLFAF